MDIQDCFVGVTKFGRPVDRGRVIVIHIEETVAQCWWNRAGL